MLTPPERRTSPNVAFLYSASTTFSKSGHFIPGNEGAQNVSFCCWAPPAASNTSKVASGRRAQLSQNVFEKTLFHPITVCCWPTILVKIAPNRSCCTFGPPLAASNTSKVASGVGGPKCLKICSKNHFLSEPRCVAGPELWSKLLQIEAASLLGPPFRPETRRR